MVKTDKDNFKLFPNKILLKNLLVKKKNRSEGVAGASTENTRKQGHTHGPARAHLLPILTCSHLPVSTHIYPDFVPRTPPALPPPSLPTPPPSFPPALSHPCPLSCLLAATKPGVIPGALLHPNHAMRQS